MFSGFGGGKKSEETPGTKAMELSKPPEIKSGGSIHGFDPTALERAAKAAKDLDSSKNSKDALKLISTQEITKQKEQEAERAKYKALQEQYAMQRIQMEEESASRTLENQSQHERSRAQYKDELERKRMVDQINAQRHLQEEERKRNEDSLRRQEEIRRKTLEYESELRQQTEMARVKAETEGRILQERKNHDLLIEKKILEAKEFRETVLESIKLAGTTIGEGMKQFLGDRDKLLNSTVTLTALAFGLYTAKVSTGVVGRYVEARLGKPSLVRETTKTNIIQAVKSPVATYKLFFGKANALSSLSKIVLENSLSERLKRIAVSTANTKKNRAPFRHLLLHGPPGTGKTMFAKGLARQSGLHYAIMTGGDIAPLGKDAVTQIHKLFDWANTTNKGVLIFIDEADAFLRKRSNEKISEDMRNALNAFLYRTGEASNKFMVVYASNQPEQFDWAINDRIDEMVAFKLPGLDERIKMISQYMEIYLTNPSKGSKMIDVSGITQETITSVAVATDGYSGREISKLAIAWQAAAYGTDSAVLNADMFLQVLEESKESKRQKKRWLSDKEIENLTTI